MITACGDSGSSSSGAQTSGSITRPADSTGSQIKGSPETTATVGQAYRFQPTVASASSATKFSITNTPLWAKFDAKTGTLSGTPNANEVGVYPGITISLVDGANVVVLPAFSITVTEANPQSNVTLSWQPPSENADGSPLKDLKGYKVHYGPRSKKYSDIIQVANPGLTTYVVQNLDAGKYYFAVTAYNAAGQESSLSQEVSTQVD